MLTSSAGWNSLPENQRWTLCYRKSTGPVFHRVTNWNGTWDEARVMAGRMTELHPELKIWYTTTKAAEETDYVCDEDKGNILTDSGKRVRIVDNGVLPNELLPTSEVNRSNIAQEINDRLQVLLAEDPIEYLSVVVEGEYSTEMELAEMLVKTRARFSIDQDLMMRSAWETVKRNHSL